MKFSSETLLPEIVAQHPATRAVLDRYGLHGCGGPFGPRETVAWFARMHGVPLDQLLSELDRAAAGPQPAAPAFQPTLADAIYRPFFIAGIIVLLTLGATLGAINLFLIGRRAEFGGIDFSWTLAHGHAMIFGFVGFFIMGFACQAFPRLKRTRLWRPRLAFSCLPLMAVGISLQALAHALAPRPPYLALGLAAALMQLCAVAVFAVVIWRTLASAPQREPFDRFVRAALVWWALAALANPLVFWLFESAPTRAEFVRRVAAFDLPYREIEIYGLIVMMILGVSMRFLPHAYGLRIPAAGWRRFVFWTANGAIACGAGGFIAGMWRNDLRLAALAQTALALAFFIIAVFTPRQYGLFRQTPEHDRGLKFIRAAHVWFIIATAMFLLLPFYCLLIYQPLTGADIPFSHAYLGAYRHALTVGFITSMIVGVSSKVVPTLSGVDLRRAAALWPTFALLNLGCAMRVATQIGTDYSPAFYPVMGMSGFIELAALALWSAELVRNMRVGKRLEREALASGPRRTVVPMPATKIADLLQNHPQTLDVFLRHGFTPLANPVLRRTMARVTSLEQACRREGVDLALLLDDLRRAIEREKEAAEGQSERASTAR